MRKDVKNEAEIYLSVDHPQIARLEYIYESNEHIHLVMELMTGGELFDRLLAKNSFSEQATAHTARSMLLAIAYLHAHKICHRDLKPENFLYQDVDSDNLKLIDFGLATMWDGENMLTEKCGTVGYVAPEVVDHSYGDQADMWSLGVICHILLTGKSIFPFNMGDAEILRRTKSRDVTYSSCFGQLSAHAQDFVSGLLAYDPTTRLTACGALEHSFLQQTNEFKPTFDIQLLSGLRKYAESSQFQRVCFSMMAWSVSQEDRDALNDVFFELDGDNKGAIPLHRFKTFLEERFNVDAVEAEQLFASLDTNHDNEIGYSELLAATLQDRVCMDDHLLRKTFSRFDQELTGRISADTLSGVLDATNENAEVEEILHEIDVHGTGAICYDDFCDLLQGEHMDHSDDEQASALKDDASSASTAAPGLSPSQTPRTSLSSSSSSSSSSQASACNIPSVWTAALPTAHTIKLDVKEPYLHSSSCWNGCLLLLSEQCEKAYVMLERLQRSAELNAGAICHPNGLDGLMRGQF
jgi:calcium-dependent protein kinase